MDRRQKRFSRRGRSSPTYMYNPAAIIPAAAAPAPTEPSGILGANLIGWWDASDTGTVSTTLVGAYDKVTEWRDKSVTGIDLAPYQANAGYGPRYYASVFNGLHSMYFYLESGSSQAGSSRKLVAAAAPFSAPPFTVWYVFAWTNEPTFPSVVPQHTHSFYSATNNYYHDYLGGNSVNDPVSVQSLNTAVGYNIEGYPQPVSLGSTLHVHRYSIGAGDPGDVNYAIDGVVQGTATLPVANRPAAPTTMVIGAKEDALPTRGLWGWFCEMIVADSVSAANSAAIDAYLTDKWGL